MYLEARQTLPEVSCNCHRQAPAWYWSLYTARAGRRDVGSQSKRSQTLAVVAENLKERPRTSLLILTSRNSRWMRVAAVNSTIANSLQQQPDNYDFSSHRQSFRRNPMSRRRRSATPERMRWFLGHSNGDCDFSSMLSQSHRENTHSRPSWSDLVHCHAALRLQSCPKSCMQIHAWIVGALLTSHAECRILHCSTRIPALETRAAPAPRDAARAVHACHDNGLLSLRKKN